MGISRVTQVTLVSLVFAGTVTAQSGSVYVTDEVVKAALITGGVFVNRPQIRVEGVYHQKPVVLPREKAGSLIFYVTAGSGTLSAGTRTLQLSEGDLLILPADTPQSFRGVAPSISYLRVIIPAMSPDPNGDVTFVPAANVAATLKKAAPLAEGPGFRVSGGYRPFASRDASPVAEIHSNEGDLFFIASGRAVQMLGGAVVGAKETGPGQIRGPRTEGGVTYELDAGDIMWVPAGMPHWFPEIPEALSYLLVKVLY